MADMRQIGEAMEAQAIMIATMIIVPLLWTEEDPKIDKVLSLLEEE